MWGTRTSYVHTFPKTRYVYKWIRLLDLCRWGPCWLVSFGFLVTCVVGVKEILLFSLSLFGENFSEQRQWSYGMWRNWVFSKHVLLKIRKLCLRSVVFLKISEFLWYRGFAAPSVERTPGKWHVPCSTLFLVQMLIVQHSFWFSGCGRFPVNAGCLGSLCLDGWIVPSEAIQGLDQKLTSAFFQIDPVFVLKFNLKHKLVLIPTTLHNYRSRTVYFPHPPFSNLIRIHLYWNNIRCQIMVWSKSFRSQVGCGWVKLC